MTDRRVRKTKQILKNALFVLMTKKDFQSIKITEIVNLADCNRGTFYAHYETKEDLIVEMVDEMITGLVRAFQTPYKNVNYIDLHSLSPSTIAIFDYILENADFYKLMLNSNVLPGFQEKIVQTIISLLKNDLVFQQNQQFLNVKIEHFITYRAYGIFGLILEWVKSDFEESPLKMAEQLIQIFNFHTPVVLINGSFRKHCGFIDN